MEQNKDLQHSLLYNILALVIKTPSLISYEQGDNEQRFIFDYSHKYIISLTRTPTDAFINITDVKSQMTYIYHLEEKENMDVVKSIIPELNISLDTIVQKYNERKIESMNKFLTMVANDIESLININ